MEEAVKDVLVVEDAAFVGTTRGNVVSFASASVSSALSFPVDSAGTVVGSMALPSVDDALADSS